MKTVAVILLSVGALSAQTYDLLIRHGHVIDPANRIDAVMDVAVAGGRIARVAPDLSAAQARRAIDATGLYVTPGLIDLHMHVFGYSGAIAPDDTALPAGTTTIVDAGGSGWRTFDDFRKTVIARSRTRVLALINIVGHGMRTRWESDPNDMDPQATAGTIARNRDVIVGIKTAHFNGTGWTAIERAVAAGKLSNTPVMVDDKIFTDTGRTTREELLDKLRPGDLHTHTFNDRQVELVSRITGKVQPYIWEARKRGVLFDMGHGGGSFLWPVAEKAMAQGFAPDTISTDLHAESIMTDQPDMPNCISKLMLLGMTLEDAILRSTVSPAKAIHRFPEIGTLSEGAGADIAILDLRTGVFAFKDAWQVKRLGTRKLECVYTVRGGNVAYERVPARPWPAESTEIYDLLLKGGRVVDRSSGRDGRFDVGIAGGKILRIGENLPGSHARTVVEAGEYTVTAGRGEAGAGRKPEYETLRYGITGPGGGKLSEGAAADIALFEERQGLPRRCVLTIRGGKVLWDPEGLSSPDSSHAGPYSNFK